MQEEGFKEYELCLAPAPEHTLVPLTPQCWHVHAHWFPGAMKP